MPTLIVSAALPAEQTSTEQKNTDASKKTGIRLFITLPPVPFFVCLHHPRAPPVFLPVCFRRSADRNPAKRHADRFSRAVDASFHSMSLRRTGSRISANKRNQRPVRVHPTLLTVCC